MTTERQANDLRTRLADVYWIGGGPGGGKSTVARHLAERHGLARYATDATMAEHARRSTPTSAPYLERFKAMDMDERWVNQPPQTMFETFHWFRGECFDLIVEDLLRVPAGTRVVVEGLRLLPHLVEPLLADPTHAVWLLPTPEFRAAALDSRDSTWEIPNRTSDPRRARDNMVERDSLFVESLTEQTRRLGLPAVRLEAGRVSEDELVNQVARMLGLDSSAHDQ